MARIFASHPMVGDRIDRVNALIARFPERGEYTINTSEFQVVKGRLVAFTNARGRADAEAPELRKTSVRRSNAVNPLLPKALIQAPPAAIRIRRPPHRAPVTAAQRGRSAEDRIEDRVVIEA